MQWGEDNAYGMLSCSVMAVIGWGKGVGSQTHMLRERFRLQCIVPPFSLFFPLYSWNLFYRSQIAMSIICVTRNSMVKHLGMSFFNNIIFLY